MTEITKENPAEKDPAAQRKIPAIGLFGRSGTKPASNPDRAKNERHAIEAA